MTDYSADLIKKSFSKLIVTITIDVLLELVNDCTTMNMYIEVYKYTTPIRGSLDKSCDSYNRAYGES